VSSEGSGDRVQQDKPETILGLILTVVGAFVLLGLIFLSGRYIWNHPVTFLVLLALIVGIATIYWFFIRK
jgi:hypothetical protein